MKDGIMKYIVKGAVGVGCVAAPAFGGQLVSAIAKAKSTTIKENVPNFVADLGAGVGVAGVVTGLAWAVAGKRTALKVGMLAGGGALIGALMPPVDDVIDSAVQSISGGAAPSTPISQAARAQVQPPSAVRSPLRLAKPGGTDISRGIGGAMPGGVDAVAKTGGVLR